MHGIFTCDYNLEKWGKKDDKCEFSENQAMDDIVQYFIECE